jgi:hypothetical protein
VSASHSRGRVLHVTRQASNDGVFETKPTQIVVELRLDVREVPNRASHPTTPESIDGLPRDAAAAVTSSEQPTN